MILKVIVNGDYILPRDIIPDIIYNKIRSCIHSKYEIHIVVSTFTGYIDSIGISVNNRVLYWLSPDSIYTFNHKEHIDKWYDKYSSNS